MATLKRHRSRTDDGPRHSAIAASLSKRLAEGEWQTGSRIPSFRRLAKEYGVSLGTVQRAFRTLRSDGAVCVTPDRPTVAALGVSLSALTEEAIAFVSTNNLSSTLRSDSNQEVWRGIQNGVGKTGCLLMVLHSGRWRHEYPAGLRHLPLKGILLLGPFKPGMLKQYESMPHSVVLLDQPGDAYKLNSVALSNYDAAFNATTRMIALGHRNVALLRRLTWSLREIDPDSKERQMGFVAACKKAGLKETQYRVFTVSGKDPGLAVSDIAPSEHAITSILAVDDECAERAVEVAKAAGVRIPQDLSILAFTSTLSEQTWSGPRTDFERLGRKGVELLFRIRDGIEQVRVPTVWHEGNTFGPPPRRN